jgi:hypothetical protein
MVSLFAKKKVFLSGICSVICMMLCWKDTLKYGIIFICGLFNDDVSKSDYVASYDRVINEW